MDRLALALLGRPQIYLGGERVQDLKSSKAQALLFYLAVTGQSHSRQTLAGLLWSDSPEHRARNNLRVELTKLRPRFGDYLIVQRRAIAFNRESNYELDVGRFETLLKPPQPGVADLREAAALYQGEFLEDFNVYEAPLFEDWQRAQRERFRNMIIRTLYTLSVHAAQAQQYRQGVTYLNRLLEIEPLMEEAHRQLMLLLASIGQRGLALAQYETCREVLAVELGVEPSEETDALYNRILAGDISGEGVAPIVLQAAEEAAPPAIPFQAPRETDHFVGREPLLDKLGERLTQAETPQVYALVGMGGVGKTTLATHLAHLIRDHFAGGVLWGNVTTSQPGAIIETWAEAFGYDFSRLQSVQLQASALRSALEEKHVLVVLDDATSVTRTRLLLDAVRGQTAITTTRNLDLARSLEMDVTELPVLAPESGRRLLVEILGPKRVAAESSAAGDICALLQNLPLAVEIAAQRLKKQPRLRLASMVARLQNAALEVLQDEHLVVRTSFEVSWATLPDDLKRALRLLAVFEGRPFAPEALAAVAKFDDAYTAEDKLFALADLSLVRDERARRYQQHPLLADFAREKLEESGRQATAFGRMARYFCAFATENQQDYAALSPEWENVMAGMRTAHSLKRWPLVIDYAATLTEPWFARGRFTEARAGYAWMEAAAAAENDEAALATCRLHWGRACIEQNDYAKAEALLLDARDRYQAVEDAAGMAEALYHLGKVAHERDRVEEAERFFAASQTIKERLEDRAGVAAILYNRARIFFRRGLYADAEALCARARAMQAEAGDRDGYARTLRFMAGIAIEREDLDTAGDRCLEALTLCRELDNQDELAHALYTLGAIRGRQSQLEDALNYLEESERLFQKIGNRKMQGLTLYELSIVKEKLAHYEEALALALQSQRLLQAARDQLGIVLILMHLGDLYEHLDEPESMRHALHEARDLAEAIGHERFVNTLDERLNTL